MDRRGIVRIATVAFGRMADVPEKSAPGPQAAEDLAKLWGG